MHGNTPHAGSPPGDAEPTAEHRRTLRRELIDVAASTRELLSDEFVVGGEISDDDGALRATVAVQPPAGSVVSAGLDEDLDGDASVESLARDLAAGAVLEAKHAARDTHSSAS
jgi:hypothetical protein